MADTSALYCSFDRYLFFGFRIVPLINRNLHGFDKRYPVAIGPRLCPVKADSMMRTMLALRAVKSAPFKPAELRCIWLRPIFCRLPLPNADGAWRYVQDDGH